MRTQLYAAWIVLFAALVGTAIFALFFRGSDVIVLFACILLIVAAEVMLDRSVRRLSARKPKQ